MQCQEASVSGIVSGQTVTASMLSGYTSPGPRAVRRAIRGTQLVSAWGPAPPLRNTAWSLGEGLSDPFTHKSDPGQAPFP